MALIIQKYGGTSVGTLERLQHVAENILKTRALGHQVVVVVSAMSGETDRLIDLAKIIQSEPNPREYAALVTTGEQISAALLTMKLLAIGCPARSYTGAQIGMHTDSQYEQANILNMDITVLTAALKVGQIPIVAGFQGISPEGDVTTLGRGGSDTSAVAIAAALQADECQIYTDVDGVYTSDPRVVPQARRLDQISFTEMLALASAGAKVLQSGAVELIGKYRVPVRVLSSFSPGPGTLVSLTEKNQPLSTITGIAISRHEAKFVLSGIAHKPHAIARLFTALHEAQLLDILSERISASINIDFAFTLPRAKCAQAQAMLQQLSQEFGTQEIANYKEVSRLTLVGNGLSSNPTIIGTLSRALESAGVTTHFVVTSASKISIVTDEKDIEQGARALHAAFNLEHDRIVVNK